MKSVLVTYGSKRGGTAGIAASIATDLREQGLVVVCKSVTEVRSLARYDAIVIGGALYAHRWINTVRRFVRRNERVLRSKPVWLFSSGPLDDSASKRAVATVPQVAKVMARIGARDHITFGGRLEAGASGFIAGSLAKSHAGDWRDWRRIRDWSHYIAAEIEKAHPVAPAPELPARWPLATLCLAVAVTAIVGGGALVIAPDGALLHVSPSLLVHSPFTTFRIPGLLLAVVGVANAVAALHLARARPTSYATAGWAGATLLGWIVTEMIMLRSVNLVQLGYSAVAIAILVASIRHTCHRAAVPAS